MRRKLVRGGVAVLVLGLLGVWIAGELLNSRTNPPLRYAGVILTPEADQVLRRACFDCHSNETRYPAYSYLPVASLLLWNHVREGRAAANFSEWGQMNAEGRRDAIEESIEQIQEGEMPVKGYVWLHPDARISAADWALLQQAARAVYGVTAEGAESDKRAKEKKGEKGEREERESERR